MQTINLDLSVRSIIPLLHAKQGDVGRKFKAILTDGGAAYPVPAGATVSVWYSGASGEGNYTDIGADSAVSVSGNEITVELITQMLANYGEGKLCLAINTADGDQIGTWNIPYMVEPLPGMGSAAAQQYFTAFSQAVQNLPYPDTTLSVPGRAADAGAVGTALAGKAPAGFGLGETSPRDIDGNDANNATRTGVYWISTTTANTPSNAWLGIMDVKARSTSECVQTIYYFADDATHIYTRNKTDGVFRKWQNRGASAFAPDGFGLGVSSPAWIVADCDRAVRGGWYRTGNSAANAPFANGAWMRADMFSALYGVQTLYSEKYGGIATQRYIVAGVWRPWEYVNPPMVVGVEYRTTERYDGKPVYTKAISVGELGSNTADNVTHDTENIDAVWVAGGYWLSGGARYSLPFFDDTENYVIASAYSNVIRRVYKGSAYAISGMVVIIKYTKTTD